MSMSMPLSEWPDNLLVSKQPVIPPLSADQDGLMNMPSMEHETQQQNLREGSVEMSLTSSPKPTSCHDLQMNEVTICLNLILLIFIPACILLLQFLRKHISCDV